MQNLKFFTLLRTLEEEEVPAFHKFLKQLHGGEDVALRVFNYIRKFYPDFRDDKKLELAYAYRKIFGAALAENENNRKKMLNVLSDLHRWLRDFLWSEKARHDSLGSQVLWLEILQERGLKTGFSKQATGFYAAAKAAPQKGANGCLMEIVASYFHYEQLALVRPAPDLGALQQCLDTFETGAETIRLKMTCQIANLKKVRPPSTPGLPTALPSLESPEPQRVKNSPLLLLYQDIYQLVVTEQEQYYNRIETAIAGYAGQLDPDELHGVISYLHNYAAVQIRNNREAIFGKKVHRLNQLGLQHHIFSQKEVMSATQFTNIVNAACSVKDFAWATAFIGDKNRFLPDNVREDTVRLAQAIVCFEKKDFKQAMALIALTDFKDIHHVIRSRLLVLRSYMALQEQEDKILNYCAAFEALLGRTPKPKTEAVEAALVFVRLFKMLVLETSDRQTLLDRIDKTPNLYYRNWLLEQVVDYKGRYAPHKRSK